ncbi:hypothetical protein GCM10007962_28640 [Yeosuana aromativorans]|uniref:Outer membrane protein beta-barrel domain-containing protein n=1 Tax=Yeosuana aromativorans TaxID=288019 RepID=A0A8J3BMS5_9FLAO|nr:porin family protein [Yeosuana aromativorans]GGK32570.1 hypothetical protein GCM10007962_28640 [Yeosuana aromativorans]
MKKLFLTAFAVFVFVVVNAQSDNGDFTLAPQVGVNFSTYSSSDASYDARTSFAGGIVGEYYLSDRWSLRSGLLYDSMGAKDSYDNIDKLNYLTIPLNANWHFGKTRNWYLNFGPAVAIILSAKSDLSGGQTIDVKDYVSGTDIGIALGIGYKFDINDNFQLCIDYQGYGGIINIDNSNNLPYDIRNSRSSFNIGGIFKL